MNTAMSSSDLLVDGNTKSSTNKHRPAASVYWCFTLNNYTDSEVSELRKWLCLACLDYRAQSEVGVQGTPHLQGFIKLKKPGRPMETNPNKRIHWEKARNIKASMSYCAKADTADGLIIIEPDVASPSKAWELDLIEFVTSNSTYTRWYYSTAPDTTWNIIKYIKQKMPHVTIISEHNAADDAPTKRRHCLIIVDPPNIPNTYHTIKSLHRDFKHIVVFSKYCPKADALNNEPILITNILVEECVESMLNLQAEEDPTIQHNT